MHDRKGVLIIFTNTISLLCFQGCLVHYYKDRPSYLAEPTQPLNLRPLDLSGYTLLAGTVEPPYAITLMPLDPDDIRKVRCNSRLPFIR